MASSFNGDDGEEEGTRGCAGEVEEMKLTVLMDSLPCWARLMGLVGLELNGVCRFGRRAWEDSIRA